jgi:hypothetical protein
MITTNLNRHKHNKELSYGIESSRSTFKKVDGAGAS